MPSLSPRTPPRSVGDVLGRFPRVSDSRALFKSLTHEAWQQLGRRLEQRCLRRRRGCRRRTPRRGPATAAPNTRSTPSPRCSQWRAGHRLVVAPTKYLGRRATRLAASSTPPPPSATYPERGSSRAYLQLAAGRRAAGSRGRARPGASLLVRRRQRIDGDRRGAARRGRDEGGGTAWASARAAAGARGVVRARPPTIPLLFRCIGLGAWSPVARCDSSASPTGSTCTSSGNYAAEIRRDWSH